MDRRHIALGTLWLLLFSLTACTAMDVGPNEPDHLITVLSGNSPEDFPPRERVILTWVFRTEDCLTCQAFPAEIRQIIEEHGEAVRFAAVLVGESGDTAIVKAFFRRERLEPRYVQMMPSDYRATFGNLPVPAIYVTINGRLARAEFGNDAGVQHDTRLSQFISASF